MKLATGDSVSLLLSSIKFVIIAEKFFLGYKKCNVMEKTHEIANFSVSEKMQKIFMHNYTQICQQFDKECIYVKFFTITN